jgi:hypothetical protein
VYDARMPFRAPRAVVWLALLMTSSAHAAVLRDHLYGVKALSETDAMGGRQLRRHLPHGERRRTWEARDSGTKSPLFSVDFGDAQHGWAVGKSGEILATADGGKTWTRQKSPIDTSKHLFKVRPSDARRCGRSATGARSPSRPTAAPPGRIARCRRSEILPANRGGSQENLVLEDVVLYDVAWPDAKHGLHRRRVRDVARH